MTSPVLTLSFFVTSLANTIEVSRQHYTIDIVLLECAAPDVASRISFFFCTRCNINGIEYQILSSSYSSKMSRLYKKGGKFETKEAYKFRASDSASARNM